MLQKKQITVEVENFIKSKQMFFFNSINFIDFSQFRQVCTAIQVTPVAVWAGWLGWALSDPFHGDECVSPPVVKMSSFLL